MALSWLAVLRSELRPVVCSLALPAALMTHRRNILPSCKLMRQTYRHTRAPREWPNDRLSPRSTLPFEKVERNPCLNTKSMRVRETLDAGETSLRQCPLCSTCWPVGCNTHTPIDYRRTCGHQTFADSSPEKRCIMQCSS
jgi:hypothetical protein